MSRNEKLLIFAIVCFATAEYAPLPPRPHRDGEYTKAQTRAMAELIEISTADDWLTQLERSYNAKRTQH